MKVPTVPWGVESLPSITTWLRTLAASISAGWSIEHRADGTHHWHLTTPDYASTRFTGNGTITWTVESADRVWERAGVLGDLMYWTLRVVNTSTGGSASNSLRVWIPGGYRVAQPFRFPVAYAVDAGTVSTALVTGTATDNPYVDVVITSTSNWAATASDNTTIDFSIVFEVTR